MRLIALVLLLARASTAHRLLDLRGGSPPPQVGSSSPYELNPDYEPPAHVLRAQLQQLPLPPMHPFKVQGGAMNTLGPQFTIETYAMDQPSPLEQFQQSMRALHRQSPALTSTMAASVVVWFAWQVPVFHFLLQRYFVTTPSNLREGRLASLLLSSVSHINLSHLVMNLFGLWSLGPTVRRLLGPLAPLLAGSAVTGSVFHLLFGRTAGCLGASSMTFGLLAAYARLLPNQQLGLLLFGIVPVQLPAGQLLRSALACSGVALLLPIHSSVAHAAHLGGMLFGIAHVEWLRYQWRLRLQS